MNNTAIYCRVSTDEQEKKGFSLDYQKESCIKYAEEKGLNISEDNIFLEQISGAIENRPKLNEILFLAEKGEIDSLVILKRDRLARDNRIYLNVLNKLENYGAQIHFSEEKLTGDEAIDDFMGNTLVGFAQWERTQIQKRTYSGKIQKAKSGKTPFAEFFGYRKIKEGDNKGNLEIYEPEAKIISYVFKLAIEEKKTLYKISEILNNEKVFTPSTSPKKSANQINKDSIKKNESNFWTVTAVQRILSEGDRYSGTYYAFRRKTIKKGDKKVQVLKPKEEWIPIEIPAIITKQQAEVVLELLENNRRFSKKWSKNTYSLQGKLVCDCEAQNKHFVGYKASKGTLNYRCNLYNGTKFSKDRKCKNNISEAKINSIVIDTIIEIFTNPSKIISEYLLSDSSKNNSTDFDLHRLIKEITKIDLKEERNQEIYIEGNLDKATFVKFSEKFKKQKEDLNKEIDKINDSLSGDEQKKAIAKTLQEEAKFLSESVKNFFTNASREEIKEIINLLIDKVIVPVDREKPVEIIFKMIPTDYEMTRYLDLDNPMKLRKLEIPESKKPLKYRVVNFSGEKAEDSGNKFVNFIKEKFHQFYNRDQII